MSAEFEANADDDERHQLEATKRWLIRITLTRSENASDTLLFVRPKDKPIDCAIESAHPEGFLPKLAKLNLGIKKRTEESYLSGGKIWAVCKLVQVR